MNKEIPSSEFGKKLRESPSLQKECQLLFKELNVAAPHDRVATETSEIDTQQLILTIGGFYGN